jgi:RNA polymerase-binding transcription factor
MDRKDLDRYKRALLEKRGQMSIASAEPESPIPSAGGWQGDLIDQANADTEADLQILLHQTDVRLLRAIEDALARINHGTYGVCTVCKQPISKARLEAVPWTHLCRECKERSTRERFVRKEMP